MNSLRPPLLKQLLSAHQVAVDVAVTALLTLVYGIAFGEPADLQDIPRWGAAVLVALAVIPVAWRRRWPRAVLAVTVTSGAVATALSTSPDPALAVAFVMYLIPLRFARRDALRMLAGTLLAMTAGLAVFAFTRHGVYGTGGAVTAAGLLAESALVVVVAWMIGYSVRQQRAYLAGRQEQAEQRARERLAEARRASTEERLQIAREVHDVVAHTMSVIAVQAGVASYVGAAEPGEAIRALSSIEETSRGALREMRALLNLLRAEGSGTIPDQREAALVPVPGLADLGTLAARTAEAGVEVDVVVRGERRVLPAGLDLAVYRVIQEAVTNVIKHASTDRCTVTVDYREDWLTVEITDAGIGAGAVGTGDGPAGDRWQAAGHGIAGMRERVGMYRGDFRAGPRPGRGFAVTACFPLKDAVA
jgi:signal transduction histidine kinase